MSENMISVDEWRKMNDGVTKAPNKSKYNNVKVELCQTENTRIKIKPLSVNDAWQ